MKTAKTLFATLFILVAAISFQSCGSSNDDSQELFITFTIDGQTIDVRGDARVITASTGSDLSINGSNGLDPSDSGYISIALLLPDGTVSSGTYDFAGTPFDNSDYECSMTIGQTPFQQLTTGSITITSNSGDFIEGTFSGTRVENGNTTITITNGSFRAFN